MNWIRRIFKKSKKKDEPTDLSCDTSSAVSHSQIIKDANPVIVKVSNNSKHQPIKNSGVNEENDSIKKVHLQHADGQDKAAHELNIDDHEATFQTPCGPSSSVQHIPPRYTNSDIPSKSFHFHALNKNINNKEAKYEKPLKRMRMYY